MEPHYLTLHMVADHSSQLKLTCPRCTHVTQRKMPGYYPPNFRIIVKCWYCKQVIWSIQVINKEG